jgi:hypothetical protein
VYSPTRAVRTQPVTRRSSSLSRRAQPSRALPRRGWTFTDRLALGAIFGTAYTACPRVAEIIWSDLPQGYQWMMIFSDGVSSILTAAAMAWLTEARGPRPPAASPR